MRPTLYPCPTSQLHRACVDIDLLADPQSRFLFTSGFGFALGPLDDRGDRCGFVELAFFRGHILGRDLLGPRDMRTRHHSAGAIFGMAAIIVPDARGAVILVRLDLSS